MTDLVQKAVSKVSAVKPRKLDINSGDTVGVYVKVVEGEKERLQLFKGVITKIQGRGLTRSFTVRKISEGVGVERTFPINSPFVDRVEVLAKGVVRRSRLFYLRGLQGKAGKIKSELVVEESSSAKEDQSASAVSSDVKTQATVKSKKEKSK